MSVETTTMLPLTALYTNESQFQGDTARLDDTVDGVVFYCDGSFRRRRGGWGLHGYGYVETPLTKGIGVSMLPTAKGYEKVPLPETVTPLFYLDAWGHIPVDATNNVAELQAMIMVLLLACDKQWEKVTIYTDSEYVEKGLTKRLTRWKNDGWETAAGEPVKNKDLWIELDRVYQQAKTDIKKLTIKWVKGHSNHVGNDRADIAARSGSGNAVKTHWMVSLPEGYHKPTLDVSDLILKKWLMFEVSQCEEVVDGFHYYHMFSLGQSNDYGHKKEDSLRERHSKLATLFGRRIGDATFVTYRTKTPEPAIETYKDFHRRHFSRDIVELGFLCLDVALKPAIHDRYQRHGDVGFTIAQSNRSITTPNDELVSITIDPPRNARDGAVVFNSMSQLMIDVLDGKAQTGVHITDITDELFEKVEKKGTTTLKLKPTITSATLTYPFVAKCGGMDVPVKAIVGTDMPSRNALNRMASLSPRVLLVAIAEGIDCYRFSFIVSTTAGDVIYQSPYTRFLLPLTKE